MLQKSKKILAWVLCVLMCVSMLPVSLLSVSAAEGEGTTDAYAKIQATDTDNNGVYTLGPNVVFVNPSFGSEGYTGTFKYTFGDGSTWGNGLTYELTFGVNAFAKLYEGIYLCRDTWNSAGTTVADYSGPDTVVVCPGTYGGNQWQNNQDVRYNLPSDWNNGTYNDLFTINFIGPQAGVSPVTDEIDNADPTPQNGRSVDPSKEAVSTSTMWEAGNVQYIVDGMAFKGQHNFYGRYAATHPYSSQIFNNIYHQVDVFYQHGIWRGAGLAASRNMEFNDYYIKYHTLYNSSNTTPEGEKIIATRCVFDNFYEDFTKVEYETSPNGQGYMKQVYTTATANYRAGFLGAGETGSYFIVRNSTLNNHATSHWARFKFNDGSYATAAKDSINVTFENNTFYNCGDRIPSLYDSSTKKPKAQSAAATTAAPSNYTDVICFRDTWKFTPESGALNFSFIGNTIEYTTAGMTDDYDGKGGTTAKVSGGTFFQMDDDKTSNWPQISNSKSKHDWVFRDTTMIIPTHNLKSKLYLTGTDTAAAAASAYGNNFDPSSMLILNENNEVCTWVQSNHPMNDIYAGDTMQGGVKELFTVNDGSDLAVADCNITIRKSGNSNSSSPVPGFDATLMIVPENDAKDCKVEDLFHFRGHDVEFVKLLDAGGQPVTDTVNPKDVDGYTLVAQYKGEKSVCTVTYAVKIAPESEYAFIDPTGAVTSYEFNGNTYTLDDTNRYTAYSQANYDAIKAAGKNVIVFLPGEYDITGVKEGEPTDYFQIQYNVALLGPKFGVSPLNEDMTLSADRGVTKVAENNYSVDASKEAVIKSGLLKIYYTEASVSVDGLTFQGAGLELSDATYDWWYARRSTLMGLTVENCVVNGWGKEFISGFGSNAKNTIGKNFLYVKNIYAAGLGEPTGDATDVSFIDVGAQNVEIDNIYVENKNTHGFIRTKASNGARMIIHPQTVTFNMTNSKIVGIKDKWNFIYPNFVDNLVDSWGATASANSKFYFPGGFEIKFDNNTFVNIATAGTSERIYAVRPALPAGDTESRLYFTNNTVLEDEIPTNNKFYFYMPCIMGQTKIHKVEGNIFVNLNNSGIYTDRLTGDDEKLNIDENYFAQIINGRETVVPVAATEAEFATKSDWAYMNRAMTVKSSDFGLDLSKLGCESTYEGFPTWKATSKFYCGVATFNAEDIKGNDKTTIVGIYKDAACTEQLTTDIKENTFYVLAKVEDAEQVITVTASKAAQHSFSEYVTVTAPACGKEGQAVRTCASCGMTESKVIAALKHVESDPAYVAATCDTPAGIYVTCLICNEQISGTEIEGSELGHDWTEWEITQEGACMVDTISKRTCKRDGCDAEEVETVTAPGHEFGDWTVVMSPTCEAAGVQQRVCGVCGATETLPVAATGHSYESVVTEPTCVADGKEEFVCTACGYVDESQTIVLGATGEHTWGNFIEKIASCTQPGIIERFCIVCNCLDEETRTVSDIDPFNHALDPEEKDWVKVKDGDCINPVVYERVCPDCGFVDGLEDYTDVTGYHNYELVISPASYDQTGKHEKVCPDCGDKQLITLLPRLPKFADVDSKAWYAEYMSKATALGLLKGYEDGTVRPNNFITRAEVVTMFARLAGVNTANYSTTKFTDVAKKAWFNGAIAWAEQNKIISGRTESTFDPNGNINRQELCAILVRYASFADIELDMLSAKAKFADDAKIAKFAKESVYLCQRAGIVSGRPGNLFAPTAYATRAEVAKILVTFIEDYDLSATSENAVAKKLALEVEAKRHNVVVTPLEEKIADETAMMTQILEDLGMDAADLKEEVYYQDAIVAAEYDLASAKLALENTTDEAEKTALNKQIADLEAEIETLNSLSFAAGCQFTIENLQEELANEHQLHADNLAAIEEQYA